MIYESIQREADSFQRPLDEAQLLAICQHTFDSPVQAINEIASGMFNNTYLITLAEQTRYILRVAPASEVDVFSNEQWLMRREISAEPHFAVLGNLIPKTIRHDFSQTIIPRDYAVQTFLVGELWDEIKDDLSDDQQAELWRQLGEIAAKIHAIEGQHFGFPEPMPQFDTWSTALIYIATEMYKNGLALKLNMDGVPVYLKALEAGHAHLDEIKTPHLLHGDLWAKNVLIQRDPLQIVGLLDSERAVWGDPMAEWIFYYETVHPNFWLGYGEKPPESAFRAAAYLGLYSVQLYLEAYRFGWDDDFIRKNLAQAVTTMNTIMDGVSG